MSNLLKILIELQRLKRLDRTGWTLRDLPNGTESVAAHSFGVGITAMLLVKVADVVDLLVEALALERAGARGLDEFWEVARTPDFKLDGAAQLVTAELFHSLLSARSEIGWVSAGNG